MKPVSSSDHSAKRSSVSSGDIRRQLLARKLRRSGATKVDGGAAEEVGYAGYDTEGVVRVDRTKAMRPSLPQEQMWLLNELDPGRPAYNVGMFYCLRGAIDVAALESALTEIVRRHEGLRSSINLLSDGPRLVLNEPAPVRVEEIELGEFPRDEAFSEALGQATQAAYRPFDLSRDNLLRAHLYRIGPGEAVLLLNTHHMASDAWSVAVLWGEFSALYKSSLSNEAASLPALSVNYADYAHWQRSRLAGARIDESIEYWKSELAGVPGLQLPLDHLRPAEASSVGDGVVHRLPRELTRLIHALAEREGATAFMVLLAAFKVLLSRLTGQSDFAVGTAVAGRGHRLFEPLVGCFINMLAVRSAVKAGMSFAEVLTDVREKTLEALEHDHMPFDKLLPEIGGTRDQSLHPIYQTVFVMHNTPPIVPNLHGLEIEDLGRSREFVRLDLSLTVDEDEDGFAVSADFRSDILEKSTVERWMRHFEVLLGAVVEDSSLLVSKIPLMTTKELQVILRDWNRTECSFDAPLTMHGVVLQRAQEYPDSVALDGEEGTLTFSELEQQSGRVAMRLAARGVEAGSLVALFVDRSPAMIIALLGILRAGGAYVPIDTNLPRPRVKSILDGARSTIAVASRRSARKFPGNAIEVNCIEDLVTEELSEVSVGLPVVVPTDLAYVIYTSGSTGVPKGVQIEHRAAANFALGFSKGQGIGPGDRIMQRATISFDLSVEEIFGALFGGATLVFRGDEMMESVRDFLRVCRESRITGLSFSSALWHTLVREMKANELTLPESLRFVTIGGEAASLECVRIWREKIGTNVRLMNSYGPTETAVTATDIDLSNLDADSLSDSVPIGRPVPNTTTYIVDKDGEPVPIGVAGELWIGGAQVARGYHDMPEASAKAFIADKFSGLPGARLYRSGDLVRYRPDGLIDFVGRTDHQVKIRGFRVELGDVEAALQGCDEVSESVVIAIPSSTHGKELVAYLVPRTGVTFVPEQLRGRLREVLPDYMIPSHLVVMEKIPMSNSGKVDRASLPGPEQVVPENMDTVSEPMTETEELVIAVWEDIFPERDLGRDDNFFEIGGDSLKAMQVVGRLKAVVSEAVSVRWLFNHPTVQALAARIDDEA